MNVFIVKDGVLNTFACDRAFIEQARLRTRHLPERIYEFFFSVRSSMREKRVKYK